MYVHITRSPSITLENDQTAAANSLFIPRCNRNDVLLVTESVHLESMGEEREHGNHTKMLGGQREQAGSI